jgi:hypothetical protein
MSAWPTEEITISGSFRRSREKENPGIREAKLKPRAAYLRQSTAEQGRAVRPERESEKER